MFTDVEASTPLLRQLGDAAFADVLERMHAIVRAAVEAHAGTIVNTEGDGSFAAFGSARDGVRAATDAQRRLSMDSAVRVRMGLHVGHDIAPRDGDYVALAVHQAARICAAAHGGQILLTGAVATAESGVAVLSLGSYSVRDFDGPVTLYEVAGLTGTGLAPRVPPAFDTQVPRYHHALVGRDTEIADVVEYLEHGSLVSLVGAPGIGKTRLAVAVLSQLSPQLAAGAWFVDLTQAVEARGVGDVIAAAVGCPPGTEIGAHLDALLDERRGMLVLDHCDHLPDAARSVAALLVEWCPSLQVIATSTSPLGIAAEVVCSVGALGLPLSASPADVLDSAAGRLFVERAGLQRVVDMDRESAGVSEVCELVRGTPLALELAAALCASRLPADVVGGLGSGTVDEVVSAALDGLAPADARVLAGLTLVESPLPVEVASAVVGAVGGGDAAASLTRLVASSLLRLDTDGRYSMLHTVRTRARHRLSGGADTAVVRALAAACRAMLADTTAGAARFEAVAATAASVLRYDAVDSLERQRLAVLLAPWWLTRLGADRAREALSAALVLDPAGHGAAAVHLAIADTYPPGAETVDTEWHVQRAAILLGEHDAVDPAVIERLKSAIARRD